MQTNFIKFLLFLLFAFTFFTYGSSIFILATNHINTDLTMTYLCGKMLNHNFSGYQLSKEFQTLHHLKKNIIPNLSPPFSVMLAAFAEKFLNFKRFLIIFMSATLLINIFALSKLHSHFYPKKNKYHWIILCLFVLANLIYLPTFLNITFGQVALLLNILIVFAYLALERKKEILAGFLLAIAMNIKLFFGLFVVLLFAQKHYRALLAFIIFGVTFSLIPALLYGPTIYSDYFSALSTVTWYSINWNASFYGFFCRLFGDPTHKFNALLSFPEIAKFCYYLIFSLYLLTIYTLGRKKELPTSLTFSLTLSSMLLLSPLGWNYYFPILIIAFLINLKNIESNYYYPLLLSMLLFSLFLSAMPFPIYRSYDVTQISLNSSGNIFFFSLLLFNVATFLQVILPFKHNTTPVFSKKLIVFLLFICLTPSLIGISSVFIHNLNHHKQPKTPIADSNLWPD